MKDYKLELYFFLVVFVAILALTFFVFLPFLGALAVAAVLAVIFYPVYEFLLRWFKWRGLTAFFTLVVVFIAVFVPLSIFGFLLFEQAQELFLKLSGNGGGVQSALSLVESRLGDIFPEFTLNVGVYIKQVLSWLTQSLGGIFASTAQAVLSFFIGMISLFYFLRDGKWFCDVFVKYSPLRDKYDNEILEKVRLTVGSILKGALFVALIQGISSGVGMMIFGVPQAALWGSAAAIGALIPGIGTTIVLVPAILYLFFSVGTVPALGLLVWGILAVGLIDNLLGPILIGKGVHIHPLLILLSVLGGLAFFGPVGFLLGPIAFSLLLALAEIYNFLIADKMSE